MYDWISQLKPGQRVLDLGSGPGSFPLSWFPCSVIALDEDLEAFHTAASLPPGPYYRTFGQSGNLPFCDRSFDMVICHHALEHFVDVAVTLREIQRVLRPGGRLFVSVPNGYSLCDGIYRAVFEGGGHVNRFRKDELVALVEGSVRLRLARWAKLYSSFVYLRRLMDLFDAPPPRLSARLRLLQKFPRFTVGGAQRFLYTATRAVDRVFHTDLALYGWAFYFEQPGPVAPPVQEPAYLNVCLYCGAGHPAASIHRTSRYSFRCDGCNRVTAYFPPFRDSL